MEKLGTIISFNVTKGVARVRLDDGRRATLMLGAFMSGRPLRRPAVGDRIKARTALTEENGLVCVAARPLGN